jgi:LAGLIDADG-like domain
MNRRVLPLHPDPELQAYVIGVAIGDGNLSNPNGRAVRLRITCDKKYPALIARICSALQQLFPENKVSLVPSRGNYVNLSVYSNHLEGLLGWDASGGSKHHQCVQVPKWICEDRSLSIHCLRGLIETDGAIYFDRGSPMVIFSTVIPQLAQQVDAMMRDLGFAPRLYRGRRSPRNPSFKYQVRLSREVPAFLKLVQPAKTEYPLWRANRKTFCTGSGAEVEGLDRRAISDLG